MATKNKIALYEVRNLQGQFMGTFFALSAQAAITKALDANAAYFSTFKGSNGLRRDQLTAKLKGES